MTQGCAFSVSEGALLIVDRADGHVVWHGKPLDAPVDEVSPLPGGNAAIVLLDYMAGPPGPFANLICVNCAGDITWRGELPTKSSTEAYVEFSLHDFALSANSWSGHRVGLDLETGQIRDSEFTK